MYIYQPSKAEFFVPHPVSCKLLTFREFGIAFKYFQNLEEVIKHNKKLIKRNRTAELEDLPEFPRFYGIDTPENVQRILKITREFIEKSKRACNFSDSSDSESDDDEREASEDDDSGIETDYKYSEALENLSLESSNNSFSKLPVNSDILQTLIFTFDDICIDLVNDEECGDFQCEARHTFPLQGALKKKLKNHTLLQVEKAYGLVLRSRVLHTRYHDTFEAYFSKLPSVD